jgi:hypothetical protein
MLASRTHVGSDGDSAIRGNGESLVKVQHCPATVRRLLRVRMPADIALYLQSARYRSKINEEQAHYLCL